MADKTIVAVLKKRQCEKKCKESKDKLIINVSDYFVLHKIIETANSEDQYFTLSRHPRLKVDLCPNGYLFQDSCI